MCGLLSRAGGVSWSICYHSSLCQLVWQHRLALRAHLLPESMFWMSFKLHFCTSQTSCSARRVAFGFSMQGNRPLARSSRALLYLHPKRMPESRRLGAQHPTRARAPRTAPDTCATSPASPLRRLLPQKRRKCRETRRPTARTRTLELTNKILRPSHRACAAATATASGTSDSHETARRRLIFFIFLHS